MRKRTLPQQLHIRSIVTRSPHLPSTVTCTTCPPQRGKSPEAGEPSRRHPLLAHKRVPLDEVLSYPLVLCHPEVCEGCSQQLERLLRSAGAQPAVAEHVATHDLMLALVAAGYGIGFSSAAHIAACKTTDVSSPAPWPDTPSCSPPTC